MKWAICSPGRGVISALASIAMGPIARSSDPTPIGNASHHSDRVKSPDTLITGIDNGSTRPVLPLMSAAPARASPVHRAGPTRQRLTISCCLCDASSPGAADSVEHAAHRHIGGHGRDEPEPKLHVNHTDLMEECDES